ncbi:2-isopropylmalate synthase [Streptococcaceae bacterium ESL0729]|nr:2-isopropylmalate synthase [Streptococcaceae bacterium ESL0729]
MKKIEFLDTSLRDGEQTPGVNFSIEEKVNIAKQLEKWGISAIEAGFPAASPDSFEAVSQIAKIMTKTAVTGLARCVKGDIDRAFEALKDAKYPQVHVFIATSPVHMEYKLKMTEDEVIKSIAHHVSYARTLFDVVEFSPEDATRTERAFLLKAVQTAVDNGATYINIPDTVGYTVPEEFGEIFKYLIENIKSDRKIIFSPHCHDDLGMATANTLAAVKNGAGRVEGTVNGIGERAGNAALEEVAVALHIRSDYYQATSDIVLSRTKATSDMVASYSGLSVPKNKAVIGGNAFAHESGIHQDGVLKNPETYEIITPELVGIKFNSLPLGKLSGRHAFKEKLKELEFDFTEEELTGYFSDFKKLADKKKEITDEDIRALILGQSLADSEIILEDIELNYESNGRQDVKIHLFDRENQEKAQVQAHGLGSIEAIFNAIDKYFGQKMFLESYEIEAITSGRDAQAEVQVHVKNPKTGVNFSSKGIDYDVLKASAQAYIRASSFVRDEKVKGA